MKGSYLFYIYICNIMRIKRSNCYDYVYGTDFSDSAGIGGTVETNR